MGLIKDEDIAQIRERVNVVEVISDYVSLKKAGRYFKGLCPFHKEKTPSFMVDPDNQIWHCFGCSEGGNVYNFLMKVDHLDFPSAVELLAKRAGYTLTYLSSPQAKREYGKRDRLYEINQEAQAFFYAKLMKSTAADKARKYLKSRGYTSETAKTFKLGYALLEKETLARYLYKKGYKQPELLELGLIVQTQRGTIDRFHNRLIFPIEDIKGRPIAFGGRVLEEGDSPKYMNSPESQIYRKSSVLYGLNWAKQEIVKKEQVYVVEGYTDVISLHRAGIKNAVASCGTALTIDHLAALSRFADNIILLFDADEAGLKAASRVVEFYDKTRAEIYVMVLPKGYDPADFVEQKGGPAFIKLAEEAKTLIEFCLDRIVDKYGLKSPKSRTAILKEAFEIVSKVKNTLVEQDYMASLARKLQLPLEGIIYEYSVFLKRLVGKERKGQTESVLIDPQLKIEEELLKALVNQPENISQVAPNLNENLFLDETNRDFYLKVVSSPSANLANMIDKIENENTRKLATRLSLEPSKPKSNLGYLQELSSRLQELAIKRQINVLKTELEKLNPVKEEKRYDMLFKQLVDLEAQKRDLKSRL